MLNCTLEVLYCLNHRVAVSSCRLLVSPSFPWLGASPDRIVFDRVEGSYGVLEIKCSHTLRDLKASQLSTVDICSELDGDNPKLKRDHPYYYQLLGQMAVSGLTWGDFVVFRFDFILIETVRFDQNEWDSAKKYLRRLLFRHFAAVSEKHVG